MSLAAIQDNLMKTSLVQQTQTKSDDVSRGQEIAMQAEVKEQSRREDQVVLESSKKGDAELRDEEKERKRRKQEEEDNDQLRREDLEDDEDVDEGPRARMRTINIVI